MSTAWHPALYDLQQWDQLSVEECRAIAEQVAANLPPTFHFSHMAYYAIGGQERWIAHFTWQDTPEQSEALFSLLPGATATLGIDEEQLTQLCPDHDLVRDWQEANLYFNWNSVTIDGELLRDILPANIPALHAYMRKRLQPRRIVTLAPCLLEVHDNSAGSIIYAPRTQSKTNLQGNHVLVTRYSGNLGLLSHTELTSYVKQQGFRLPTSDEWEYACAAGTRTLFFWGNGLFDMHEDPALKPPAPCTFGQQATLAPGTWTPNAFGLHIADGCYAWECSSRPGIMHGGDGGFSVCGGSGKLAEALTRASVFIYTSQTATHDDSLHGAFVRRLFPLDISS